MSLSIRCQFQRDTNFIASVPKRAMLARQGIDLTGYGHPAFERAVAAIEAIKKQMSGYMPMKGADEPIASYRDWSRFSASNRFFTDKRKVPHEMLNSFGNEIDPLQILEGRAINSKVPVVHIRDNKVKYYEQTVTENEGKR